MPDEWGHSLRTRLNSAVAKGSRTQRGKRYEELVQWIFSSLDGIGHIECRIFNHGRSQEIDVAIWNDRTPGGLDFLPNVILVECKNWSHPVSSAEVAWFAAKIRERGREFGILFAAQGITGDSRDLNFAHQIIAWSLAEGRQLVVITEGELRSLESREGFVQLLKVKLVRLGASGTSLE